MATYLTPKTDWEATDPITAADYNRIKNNLVYVNDIYNGLYGIYDFDPGADIGAQEFFKASKFNMFEDCIENLQRSGTVYTFGEKSHYEENGRMPDYNQLNRIEKCTEAYANYDVGVTGVTVTPSVSSSSNNISDIPAFDAIELTASVQPAQAFNRNVSWNSSDTSIAAVDKYGKVSIKSGGTAYISAITDDGGFSDTATIYSIIQAENLQINGNIELDVGSTLDAASLVSCVPSEANFTSIAYSSSDENVFTVSSDGVITGIGNGNATLTVTLTQGYPDDPNPNVITATKAVSVIEQYIPIENITISPASLTIEKNSCATLTATINPPNATQQGITWKSDKPGVVQVNGSGSSVTIKSKNSANVATITATSEDGICSTSITVTVKIISDGTMLDGHILLFSTVQKTSSIIALMPEIFVPVNLQDYSQKIAFGNGGKYEGSDLAQCCLDFRNDVMSKSFRSRMTTMSKKNYNGSSTWGVSDYSIIVPTLTEVGSSFSTDREQSYDINYIGMPSDLIDGLNPITWEYQWDMPIITRSTDLTNVYAIKWTNPGVVGDDSTTKVPYGTNSTSIQFYKPLIYVSVYLKVFPEIKYEGAYIIDFNDSPSSIYLKDVPQGTFGVYVCDPPDEIRQQLGVL